MIQFFEVIISTINNTVSSPWYLFIIEFISIFTKSSLLLLLGYKSYQSKKISQPLYFLYGLLILVIFIDLTWVITLLKQLEIYINHSLIIFFIRIAWACNLISYQLLALFIESLGEPKYKLPWYQKALLVFNSFFVGYFLYLSIFCYGNPDRPWHEYFLINCSAFYVSELSLFPSLYFTIRKLRTAVYPKILKKQLIILIKYLICPYALVQFIESFFIFSKDYPYLITSISTSLITIALFYSVRKVMGLRFLNFQNHVQAPQAFNFITDFKSFLEQLSYATTERELFHISQMFFKEAFNVLPNRTMLFCRKLESSSQDESYTARREPTTAEVIVENFISHHSNDSCTIAAYMYEQKILITDEIAFNNFYEETEESKEILLFLDRLSADIFLPIYENQMIIAYIIVERYARGYDFYSNVERDQMLVFARYLGNIIHLLQNRNLNALIQKEKEMREELYRKHQEINQYKESIRSFIHDNKQRKIGILFYKQRRFVFGNQASKDLIDVNINVQEGHPLTKSLRQLVHQVEEYKSYQTCFVKDSKGNLLVASGLPNTEQNNVIITVYYPELADIIKKQLDQLKNPTEWDYLLYLETTKTGKLINQLIPGSGHNLLNFKIELLKIALGKKALLLEMPEEDLLPTVEILHHISLREILHTVKLHAPVRNFDVAIKLFGINPIFEKAKEPPLLERLNGVGTLFIQNVHYLDIETQNYLAELIKYGYYHVFKSDQKIYADVRIICSTTQNLSVLVQDGKFSKALYNELKQTTLSMPSLLSLPIDEFNDLVQGFTEQSIKSSAFKNLLELTPREKDKLLADRPVSLQEFKNKIQQLLNQKSKKNNVHQETHFDSSYSISDPELTEAARFGKKALKDPKIMGMLWSKFQNQNKIAAFLGVNRSSVNRRCKEFNLQ